MTRNRSLHDYANPRSDRRADRVESAEVHYLGDGPVFTLGHRALLFELLARLALPHMADARTLYEVAHAVDHVEGLSTFFLAVRRRGAMVTWDRDIAQSHLGGDPEGVLFIISVRRNYTPDRFNAYVSVDTRWREFDSDLVERLVAGAACPAPGCHREANHDGGHG